MGLKNDIVCVMFRILARRRELGSFSDVMLRHRHIAMALNECHDVRSLVRINFNLNRLRASTLGKESMHTPQDQQLVPIHVDFDMIRRKEAFHGHQAIERDAENLSSLALAALPSHWFESCAMSWLCDDPASAES